MPALVVSASGKQAHVWNLATGERVRSLAGSVSCQVSSVAVSPDGEYVVTATFDKMCVWRLGSGEHVYESKLGARHVAVSSEFLMTTASKEGRVLRLADGGHMHALTGHTGDITSVAVSPSGAFVVTASYDKWARVHSVQTGKLVRRLKHDDWVRCVTVSPKDTYMLIGAGKDACVWQAFDGELVRKLTGHTDWVGSVAVSPDGEYVVTGSVDNTARVWRLASGELVHTLEGHTERIRSVAVCPDSALVVTVSDDKTMRVWRLADGGFVRSLQHSHAVGSVCVAGEPTRRRRSPSPAPAAACASSSSAAAAAAPPSIEASVQTLATEELKAALESLGEPTNGLITDEQLRSRLIEMVEPHDDGWEAALADAQRGAVHAFLASHLSADSAARRAGEALAAARANGAFAEMWSSLLMEFCPPVPSPPTRTGYKLLAIGPGFGFLDHPELVKTIEDAGFDVYRLWDSNIVPNPAAVDFSMDEYLPRLIRKIEEYQPHAILCASKGGAYMSKLWEKMSAGEMPKYPSLMINAHPSVDQLPKGVKIVLVQGSAEEVWHKPRGYDTLGKVQPDSLEALIRTGSPALCYLYHTVTQGGVRLRLGDKHVPASLLEYDCLPRLVDSLLAEHPPFAFPASCGVFTSTERRRFENFLGFEPSQLRQFWQSSGGTGMDAQHRFVVPKGSDEFKAVKGIFRAEPSVKRFYVPQRSAAGYDVESIERIENGLLQENMDNGYSTVKTKLTRVGAQYENGVHGRWLFHGAGSANTVDAIVADPDQGFKPWLNERGLWGKGVYFARDAIYSIECPGCCDTCENADGNMMVLLCLVQTGLPTVGEEHMKEVPKVHDALRPKISYDTFVDCPSNPEIFVAPQGKTLAYPAYIIHFS